MFNLPKIWQLLFPSLLVFLSLIFLFASPIRAYSGGGPEEWQNAIDSSNFNKQSFDNEGIKNLMLSAGGQVFGGTTIQAMNRNGGGAIGMMGNTIAFMYSNRPASGVAYFADIGKNLGIVKPAYAQEGFQRLAGEGILGLWRGFRNISYFLFVILFIVMAFAIMFRVHLNPQTVITIQSALPRIIIALILVTFSFAIAGLLIDLAFVSTSIIDRVIDQVTPTNIPAQIKNVVLNFSGGALPGIFGGIVGFFIGGPLGALAGAGIGTVLFFLIFALLFLFAVLRLLWMFLMAYLGIIFKIILSPLTILFNTLPGRSIFWGWFSSLLSDIIVFPTAYLVLLLGWVVVRTIGPTFNPFVPVPTLLAPFFGMLQGLLGLGILLLIPNIVNLMKEAINRGPQLGGLTGAKLVTGIPGAHIAGRIETGTITDPRIIALYRIIGPLLGWGPVRLPK